MILRLKYTGHQVTPIHKSFLPFLFFLWTGRVMISPSLEKKPVGNVSHLFLHWAIVKRLKMSILPENFNVQRQQTWEFFAPIYSSTKWKRWKSHFPGKEHWVVSLLGIYSVYLVYAASSQALPDGWEGEYGIEWIFYGQFVVGVMHTKRIFNSKQGIKNNFSGAISFYAAHNQAFPDGWEGE